MAFGNGPRIVTSGLVLALDAADRNSYVSGSTTWRDQSGTGRNATLTNGPTFSSINGGVIVFDGTNDYAVITSSVSLSEYTFSFFCQWITETANSSRIFGSDAFGTYTILTPTNVGFHYNPLGGSPPSVTLSSGVNVGTGTWCQVTVTVSAAATSVAIYINGISRNSSSVLPNQNLYNNLYLGAQNTLGLVANCYIGNFHLYNRALSATEVLQNYNALKSRFNL